jgi:hypothetical protein
MLRRFRLRVPICTIIIVTCTVDADENSKNSFMSFQVQVTERCGTPTVDNYLRSTICLN